MHERENRYNNTYLALDTWHETKALSDQQWEDIETTEDLEACERMDVERSKPVLEALYEDTQDVQCRMTMQYLTVETITKLTKYRSRPGRTFEFDLSFLANSR